MAKTPHGRISRTADAASLFPRSTEGEARTVLGLSELNALVRGALAQTLPGVYWVRAEVSEARVAANGHCYLELVEKAERGGGLRARASAHIWRGTYPLIRMAFERATGSPLSAGMSVLLAVEVDFHEVYGYSLNVLDVDAGYTLGDMARRRREILQQLRTDGVIDMNKELPLPHPLLRIAVVSSATAAGYGDFCRQLEDSPYLFRVQLFPAVMQGEGVEQSVVAALDAIALAGGYDVVAILRGGGAVSDLSGFESYRLAAHVAQFPLPVLTGIGHERDDTVVDYVAHTRLKTPTAVADFLISRAQADLAAVEELAVRLQQGVAAAQDGRRARLERLGRALQLAAARFGDRGRQRLGSLSARLAVAASRAAAGRRQRLEGLPLRLRAAVQGALREHRRRLELAERALTLADPARILRLGFSLTTHDGRVVRDAASLSPGDRLTTTFAQGTAESIVAAASQTTTKQA